jgi:hypothetical protein
MLLAMFLRLSGRFFYKENLKSIFLTYNPLLKPNGMKCFLVMLVLSFQSSIIYSQIIATTTDGRKVILESNKTWRYLDSSKADMTCHLPADFVEPKSTKEMYRMLKPSGSSIDDLKEYVAVDNECKSDEVKIISFSEQPGNGIYNLCVKGIKMKYRRTGSVFTKFNENLLVGEK